MAKMKEFDYEALQDRETIVRYLQAICEGFTKGSLRFGSEGDEMVLQPQGLIKLGVQITSKSDKVKLSIKFAWTEEDRGEDRIRPLVIETVEER